MKAKVSSISAIICLITLVFFCILACDNGSVSDSSSSNTSGLVKVSLTVDGESSSSQKSISVDSSLNPANFTYYYRATPNWTQTRPIHGSTNSQFVLIPNYNSGSPASLGSFTAGQWLFEVQVRSGSTVIYQGDSGVTSIYQGSSSINVLVNKIIQAASGAVTVTVTAPTVASEAMTVAWSGTASGSGAATPTPLGDGTTRFTFTKNDFSSGYYTFTLNHSSTGSGAAIAVDLSPGERADITGHLENGTWQVGAVIVKVYEIDITATGCNVYSNVASAAAGDRVSFYASPYAGNVLDSVTVTWTGGTFTPGLENGLYTFIMPAGDVSVNVVYSGVNSDILVSHFKAIFKIIYDANPGATSFGRSVSAPPDNVEYYSVKNVKMWYDSSLHKICWYTDRPTMKFKSGAFNNLFKDCSNFTSISLAGMDTSAITSMAGMFKGCEGLTELDLTGLDTSAVTSMAEMFRGCEALTAIVLDTEKDANGKFVHFNTANVTDMSYMFCCKTLENGNVKPSSMSLATLDVSGLDTHNVTDMNHMFHMCWQLSELDVSGFRTPLVTDMSYMFACYNYGGVACPGQLTTLDLSDWDFTNVTTTANMFDRQEQLDSGLSFPETTNFASLATMWYMFSQCLALTPETFSDIVNTWTFENHAGYPSSIYGDTSSFFGNYNDNVDKTYPLTDARNYILRQTQTNGGSAKFKKRISVTTKDGHTLWIGKGNKGRHGKLTTEENP